MYFLRLREPAAAAIAHALAFLRASRRRHLYPLAEVMPERRRCRELIYITVAAIGALILGISAIDARCGNYIWPIIVAERGDNIVFDRAALCAVAHALTRARACGGRDLLPLAEGMRQGVDIRLPVDSTLSADRAGEHRIALLRAGGSDHFLLIRVPACGN